MNSEEQKSLEDFFKAKSIRIKNEMAEEVCTLCFPEMSIPITNYLLGFWTYCCCS
jgi:hypothetical protein